MKNIFITAFFLFAAITLFGKYAKTITNAGQENKNFSKENPKVTSTVIKEKIIPYIEEVPEGKIIVFDGQKYTFVNTACNESNSCDLENFSLREEKYILPFSGNPFFSTRAKIEIKTAVGREDDFQIIQFARGCKWDTVKKNNKTFANYFYWKEKAFVALPIGIESPPVWILPQKGSIDVLPYGASFDASIQYPDAEEGIAYNIALELKTCVYKKSAIPSQMTQRQAEMIPAIGCVEWDNIFVYNFEKKEIERRYEVDPFCKQDKE